MFPASRGRMDEGRLGRPERAPVDRAGGPDARVLHRSQMDDRLTGAIADARRAGADLVVLLIGVDALGEVNGRFGRLAGDRVLSTITDRVLGTLRAGDRLARTGGDEFVVLATDTGRQAGCLLAESVRRAVKSLHLSARGREVRVTVSIGLAFLGEAGDGEESASSLLAAAHGRMRAAKSAGRNRVSDSDP